MALIILHPTIAGAHQIILTPSTPGGGEPTNDPEYSIREFKEIQGTATSKIFKGTLG